MSKEKKYSKEQEKLFKKLSVPANQQANVATYLNKHNEEDWKQITESLQKANYSSQGYYDALTTNRWPLSKSERANREPQYEKAFQNLDINDEKRKNIIKSYFDINPPEKWEEIAGLLRNSPINELDKVYDEVINGMGTEWTKRPADTPEIQSQLQKSVAKGEIEKIEKLIQKGVRLNIQDQEGCTPLHTAVKEGRLEIVRLLLKNGASAQTQDRHNETPLEFAARKGNYKIAKELIEADAQVTDTTLRAIEKLSQADKKEFGKIQAVKEAQDRVAKIDKQQAARLDEQKTKPSSNPEPSKDDTKATTPPVGPPPPKTPPPPRPDIVTPATPPKANQETAPTTQAQTTQTARRELKRETTVEKEEKKQTIAELDAILNPDELLRDLDASAQTPKSPRSETQPTLQKADSQVFGGLPMLNEPTIIDQPTRELGVIIPNQDDNPELFNTNDLDSSLAQMLGTLEESTQSTNQASTQATTTPAQPQTPKQSGKKVIDLTQHPKDSEEYRKAHTDAMVDSLVDNNIEIKDYPPEPKITPEPELEPSPQPAKVEAEVETKQEPVKIPEPIPEPERKPLTPEEQAKQGETIDDLLDDLIGRPQTKQENPAPIPTVTTPAPTPPLQQIATPTATTPVTSQATSQTNKEQKKTVAAKPLSPQNMLFQAVSDGNVSKLNDAIEQGADVNAKDQRGQTALHYVYDATNDATKTRKALLAAGANINAANGEGLTPLHLAVKENNNVALELINYGADVNAKDPSGNPPLSYVPKSSEERYTGFRAALVTAGAEVDKKDKTIDKKELKQLKAIEDRNNKLYKAVKDGSIRDVASATTKGGNISMNRDGETLLHVALNNKKPDLNMVNTLLNAKCPVDVKDRNGKTPLHLAVEKGLTDFAKALIAKGAKITPEVILAIPNYAQGDGIRYIPEVQNALRRLDLEAKERPANVTKSATTLTTLTTAPTVTPATAELPQVKPKNDLYEKQVARSNILRGAGGHMSGQELQEFQNLVNELLDKKERLEAEIKQMEAIQQDASSKRRELEDVNREIEGYQNGRTPPTQQSATGQTPPTQERTPSSTKAQPITTSPAPLTQQTIQPAPVSSPATSSAPKSTPTPQLTTPPSPAANPKILGEQELNEYYWEIEEKIRNKGNITANDLPKNPEDRQALMQYQSPAGDTLLHVAARHRNIPAANLFIDNKANINAQNKNGSTPVYEAVANEDKDMATHLADRGANIYLSRGLFQKTDLQNNSNKSIMNDDAFTKAQQSNDKEFANKLSEAAKQYQIIQENLNTPKQTQPQPSQKPAPIQITDAMRNQAGGYYERIVKKIANGTQLTNDDLPSDPIDREVLLMELTDEHGESLLHHAARKANGQPNVDFLLKQGISIDVQNDYGETPLHQAVSNNIPGTAKYLIRQGANPMIQDNELTSAYSLADDNPSLKQALDEAIDQRQQKQGQAASTATPTLAPTQGTVTPPPSAPASTNTTTTSTAVPPAPPLASSSTVGVAGAAKSTSAQTTTTADTTARSTATLTADTAISARAADSTATLARTSTLDPGPDPSRFVESREWKRDVNRSEANTNWQNFKQYSRESGRRFYDVIKDGNNMNYKGDKINSYNPFNKQNRDSWPAMVISIPASIVKVATNTAAAIVDTGTKVVADGMRLVAKGFALPLDKFAEGAAKAQEKGEIGKSVGYRIGAVLLGAPLKAIANTLEIGAKIVEVAGQVASKIAVLAGDVAHLIAHPATGSSWQRMFSSLAAVGQELVGGVGQIISKAAEVTRDFFNKTDIPIVRQVATIPLAAVQAVGMSIDQVMASPMMAERDKAGGKGNKNMENIGEALERKARDSWKEFANGVRKDFRQIDPRAPRELNSQDDLKAAHNTFNNERKNAILHDSDRSMTAKQIKRDESDLDAKLKRAEERTTNAEAKAKGTAVTAKAGKQVFDDAYTNLGLDTKKPGQPEKTTQEKLEAVNKKLESMEEAAQKTGKKAIKEAKELGQKAVDYAADKAKWNKVAEDSKDKEGKIAAAQAEQEKIRDLYTKERAEKPKDQSKESAKGYEKAKERAAEKNQAKAEQKALESQYKHLSEKQAAAPDPQSASRSSTFAQRTAQAAEIEGKLMDIKGKLHGKTSPPQGVEDGENKNPGGGRDDNKKKQEKTL